MNILYLFELSFNPFQFFVFVSTCGTLDGRGGHSLHATFYRRHHASPVKRFSPCILIAELNPVSNGYRQEKVLIHDGLTNPTTYISVGL